MEEDIKILMKNRKFNIAKLLAYGFCKNENFYEYKEEIMEKQFTLVFRINSNFEISYKVIDLKTNDEYLPVKALNAVGEYVGNIRKCVKEKLADIIYKCSIKEVFKQDQTKQVIEYIIEKYNTEPEFLWEKFDDNAIFRKKENGKWYAALLTTSLEKFGINVKENVEIIDLRNTPDNIQKLVDNEKYFPAYHMNKRHWFTIILDGRVSIDKIFEFIDVSYSIK